MMDDKEKPSLPAATEAQSEPATETDDTQRKKTYKSPTIKRHGNLRLMTQLE